MQHTHEEFHEYKLEKNKMTTPEIPTIKVNLEKKTLEIDDPQNQLRLNENFLGAKVDFFAPNIPKRGKRTDLTLIYEFMSYQDSFEPEIKRVSAYLEDRKLLKDRIELSTHFPQLINDRPTILLSGYFKVNIHSHS